MNPSNDLSFKRVSDNPDLDERRVLLMAMQALLDPVMLRIVATLHAGERSLPDLAAELRVPPSFSRGPLGRLIFLEIIAVSQENGRILCRLNRQRLRELNGALQRLSRDLLTTPNRHDTAQAADLDEAERRLLRGYLRGERLIQIPTRPERLQSVLRWLAARFEPGRRYPEREVNELLKIHHEDFATFRRLLVDHRYMDRANGIYWLRDTPPGVSQAADHSSELPDAGQD